MAKPIKDIDRESIKICTTCHLDECIGDTKQACPHHQRFGKISNAGTVGIQHSCGYPDPISHIDCASVSKAANRVLKQMGNKARFNISSGEGL